jgi:hypothetical protein
MGPKWSSMGWVPACAASAARFCSQVLVMSMIAGALGPADA